MSFGSKIVQQGMQQGLIQPVSKSQPQGIASIPMSQSQVNPMPQSQMSDVPGSHIKNIYDKDTKAQEILKRAMQDPKLAEKIKATMASLKAQRNDVMVQRKANGGLMNIMNHEMDLRAKGGFVPIGKKERADDVPARLSKNEFVFTAKAVREAGDGDIKKGAKKMYSLMKHLEKGGNL
jgi:hypothetical protein